MIENTIQAFLEMLLMLFMISRLRTEKLQIKIIQIPLIIIDITVLNLVEYGLLKIGWTNLLFIMLFLYIKYQYDESMMSTFYYLAMVILLSGVLQLVFYYPVNYLLSLMKRESLTGIGINALGIIIVCWLPQFFSLFEREKFLVRKEKRGIGVLTTSVIAVCIATFFFKIFDYIGNWESLVLILFGASLCIALAQWNRRATEAYSKQREIEMIQLYNMAYSQMIDVIQRKQHDFGNHLNAIIGIAYMYTEQEDILREQKKYCDVLSENNKYNKLLTSIKNPILAGLLYVKSLQAENMECKIEFYAAVTKTEIKTQFTDCVEIIGILFDNAVEAVQKYAVGERIIHFSINDVEEGIQFTIKNRIEKRLTNHKLEELFKKGKSEKGFERGIGLYKLKQIVKQYDMKMSVGSYVTNGKCYIEFQIIL